MSESMNGMTKKRLGIPTGLDRMNTEVDDICMRIASGESQRKIADSFGVSAGLFCTWAADTKHSARIKKAATLSARHWDEQAETVLMDMTESPMGIARARELASHYRWRAKAYNKRDYGDQKEPTELDNMMVEKLRRELERENEDDVLPTSIEVRVVNGGSKLITGDQNV